MRSQAEDEQVQELWNPRPVRRHDATGRFHGRAAGHLRVAVQQVALMKLGVKELIELCIYCWGHPLLYTCSGSVAVWMLLSGNLQHPPLLVHQGPAATLSPHSGSLSFSLSLQSQRLPEL